MPLAPLTVCAARLLALPIFRSLCSQPAAVEVLRRFSSAVTHAQKQAVPWRLDQFLDERLREASAHCSALPADEQQPLSGGMQRLLATVNPRLCDTCAGPGGHVCSGQDVAKDQAQVTRAGLCIQLIRDMHDQVVPELRRLISAAVFDAERAAVNTLPYAWGTEWPGAPGRLGPRPEPKVGGCTGFFDSATTRHAEVILSVASDELDWPSVLMIPWLFAHEFVCHVLQIPVAGRLRERCRLACPFYEGWMDEVAFQLFQHEIVRPLDPKRWPFVQHSRQGLLDGAHQYRDWRYDKAPGASPKPETPQWVQGAEAALAVLELFQSTLPSGALHQLVRLSFQIQAAARSPNDLDHAVDACLAAAAGALAADEPMQGRALALLSAAPIGNMSTWIKALRAIK
jgi:hypothetical protein